MLQYLARVSVEGYGYGCHLALCGYGAYFADKMVVATVNAIKKAYSHYGWLLLSIGLGNDIHKCLVQSLPAELRNVYECVYVSVHMCACV